MDPLFERRELKKLVHIHSKHLQRNIKSSLLRQLQADHEGKCQEEGYIQRNSIVIVDYSLGRSNYVKGGIDYEVRFQADICMPHEGQRFKAPVLLKSKVGIHADTPPIKVLIPRDLHIGNEDFESVKINDEIEFEVVGSQFKQEDETIVVVGKLITKVAPPVEKPLVSFDEEKKTDELESNIPKSEEGSELKVVISEPTQQPGKTKRLKRNNQTNTNEQLFTNKEGMA